METNTPPTQTTVEGPRDDAAGWEYREVDILLNLSTRELPEREVMTRRYDHIVQQHLDRLARDGWRPDGPIDWDSMLSAGRIRRESSALMLPRLAVGPGYVYEAVTVRLKRSVEDCRRADERSAAH